MQRKNLMRRELKARVWRPTGPQGWESHEERIERLCDRELAGEDVGESHEERIERSINTWYAYVEDIDGIS